MRLLSTTLRDAMNAQETGEVIIILLTLDHPDYPAPLYLSSDPTEMVTDVPLVYKTVSRSQDYIFVPMQLVLPDESDEAAPHASIMISGITQDVVILARSVISPGTCKMEFVLASAPNSVEFQTPLLDILSAKLSADSVTIEVALNSMVNEPFPAHNFVPSSVPGLFGLRQA